MRSAVLSYSLLGLAPSLGCTLIYPPPSPSHALAPSWVRGLARDQSAVKTLGSSLASTPFAHWLPAGCGVDGAMPCRGTVR